MGDTGLEPVTSCVSKWPSGTEWPERLSRCRFLGSGAGSNCEPNRNAVGSWLDPDGNRLISTRKKTRKSTPGFWFGLAGPPL